MSDIAARRLYWRRYGGRPRPKGPAASRPGNGEARPAHRYLGAGRALPRRAPAGEGLRGARHRPALIELQHRPDRPPLPRPPRGGGEALHPLRRPLGFGRPGEAALRAPTRRDLPPGRAEPRPGLIRHPRIHFRHHGVRDDPAARGDSRGRSVPALLPGLLLRDVWRGVIIAVAAEAAPY